MITSPNAPAGRAPQHAAPQPGFLIYDDGTGGLWCSKGMFVATTSPATVVRVPLTKLDWRANLQTGVAFLVIATDTNGSPTSVTVAAAAAQPGDTRHRKALTTGPSDPGQAGAYHLPLANLAPGMVEPILAGSTAIAWARPAPQANSTDFIP